MLFLKLLVVFVVTSLLLDGFHAVLGLILVKTRRFHKAGMRMLAMSCFVPGRVVERNCRQRCLGKDCGNWSCSLYLSRFNRNK